MLCGCWPDSRIRGPPVATGAIASRKVAIFTGDEFEELLASQPWARVRYWRDTRYHYALCDKRVV